jgi:hypothetical protein
MDDATVESALAGFLAKLNSIPEHFGQTFTYDQGRDISRHQKLAAATGVNVYLFGVCDEHKRELAMLHRRWEKASRGRLAEAGFKPTSADAV